MDEKKPEPGEFTKELTKLGGYLSAEHNNNYGQSVCERACDEIDRLTAACKLFEVMIAGFQAELKGKDVVIADQKLIIGGLQAANKLWADEQALKG